jgi:hypothetical protein
VSRPAVLSAGQTTAYRRWLDHLAALDFAPSTLTRAEYESIPLEQLRKAIAAADGALVLGFRQLNVEQGVWRPDTTEMTPWSGWLATPWNQVEAALAIMARVPVLVAPEGGVTEGVFSSHVWADGLYGVDLHLDLAFGRLVRDADVSYEAAPSLHTVMAWARQVRAGAPAVGPDRTRGFRDGRSRER